MKLAYYCHTIRNKGSCLEKEIIIVIIIHTFLYRHKVVTSEAVQNNARCMQVR